MKTVGLQLRTLITEIGQQHEELPRRFKEQYVLSPMIAFLMRRLFSISYVLYLKRTCVNDARSLVLPHGIPSIF